jgi:hypothetical protein
MHCVEVEYSEEDPSNLHCMLEFNDKAIVISGYAYGSEDESQNGKHLTGGECF